jgi:hypothetical protein
MVVFGFGSDVVRVRSEGEIECPVCECEQPFSLFLHYEYSHVYGFGAVTKREYHVLCDECEQGKRVKRKQIEPTLERLPIPFMRQHGIRVFPFVAVVVFVLAILMAIILGDG